jgi:Fic family protein
MYSQKQKAGDSEMNILSGKLDKRQMANFTGVKYRELDKSLARLADMGYLKYRKIKGKKYKFILYPEPVRELELNNGR